MLTVSDEGYELLETSEFASRDSREPTGDHDGTTSKIYASFNFILPQFE